MRGSKSREDSKGCKARTCSTAQRSLPAALAKMMGSYKRRALHSSLPCGVQGREAENKRVLASVLCTTSRSKSVGLLPVHASACGDHAKYTMSHPVWVDLHAECLHGGCVKHVVQAQNYDTGNAVYPSGVAHQRRNRTGCRQDPRTRSRPAGFCSLLSPLTTRHSWRLHRQFSWAIRRLLLPVRETQVIQQQWSGLVAQWC